MFGGAISVASPRRGDDHLDSPQDAQRILRLRPLVGAMITDAASVTSWRNWPLRPLVGAMITHVLEGDSIILVKLRPLVGAMITVVAVVPENPRCTLRPLVGAMITPGHLWGRP